MKRRVSKKNKSLKNRPILIATIIFMIFLSPLLLSARHGPQKTYVRVYNTLYNVKTNAIVTYDNIFHRPPPISVVQVAQQTEPTSTITPIPTAGPPVVYTSEKLGVSFHYLPFIPNNGVYGGTKFYIRETGNTIYVYSNRGNQEFTGNDADFLEGDGIHYKYVQVFNKDPQQSLHDAVKEQILKGYSEKDCILMDQTPYGRSGNIYMPVQTVMMRIPRSDTPRDRSESFELAKKCPMKYLAYNGVVYFQMDQEHPDKFLFFSIGQSPLMSGIDNYTWDQTIRVFK